MNAPACCDRRLPSLAAAVLVVWMGARHAQGGEYFGSHHRDFQGFGLKYHPGYGYGGRAIGVGPFGGYPRYGGPGAIVPFCPVGPLVETETVAIIVPRPESWPVIPDTGAYGPYTGALPYPESLFAPYTAAAAANARP